MDTVRDLLVWAATALDATDSSPRLDAEVLLAHTLDKPRSWLYAHPEATPEPRQVDGFRRAVSRRRTGEPIAHLTGRRDFWTLSLGVTADTLIPRPETELLVEWALDLLPDHDAPEVLDLGTGSGAIALAIASERRNARVTATDASEPALSVARRNAIGLGHDRIRWLAGDWFGALPHGQRFDLILSNPPYIAAGDPHLARGDLRFEPATALVAPEHGLAALRQITGQAHHWLKAGGWLLLEHGWDQGAAVRAMLEQAGLIDIATREDLAGQERASGGRFLP